MQRRVARWAMTTLATAVVVGGLVSSPAVAAPPVSTWTGQGEDALWSNPDNWEDGRVPFDGEDLVFPDVADSAQHSPVNDLAPGTTLGTVRIEEAGYVLGGNAFTTDGLYADYPGGESRVTQSVELTGDATVSVSGGTFRLAGSLYGTHGLDKTGAGVLVVQAAGFYTGVTTIAQGTVAMLTSTALGESTAGNGTTVADGATLELHSTSTSEPVEIAGGGVNGLGALFNAVGNNNIRSVTLTDDAAIGSWRASYLTVKDALVESGGPHRLTKVGEGPLIVEPVASHTGGTHVAVGPLVSRGTVPGAVTVGEEGSVYGFGGHLGDVTVSGGGVSAGFVNRDPYVSYAESLTLDGTARFEASLQGPAVAADGDGYSQLVVAHGATLGGAMLMPDVLGYTPMRGDVHTIITTQDGVTGTFKNLPEGAVVTADHGEKFRISYVGGPDGHDVTLTAVTATTTSLATSPDPSAAHADVTLTATVSPSSATGTVTFKDGSTTLGTGTVTGGTATLTTDSLTSGAHTLTAEYAGGDDHLPSTSSGTAHTVDADTTAPDSGITSGPSGVVHSGSASFAFTSPDGDVDRFECQLDAGPWVPCTSPVSFTGLADGEHTVRVRAIDTSDNVEPSPASRTWTVDTSVPAPPPTVVPVPAPAKVPAATQGGKVYPRAASTGVLLSGRAVAGATLTLRDGTRKVGTTTVGPDGRWSVRTAPLSAGRHVLTATQSVGGDTSASATVATVTVEPLRVSVIKTVKPSHARRPLVRGRGNPGAVITLRTVGGKVLGRTTVDDRGRWRLRSARLARGPHRVRAVQTIAGTTLSSAVLTIRTTARR